jgi:hypothetical protein
VAWTSAQLRNRREEYARNHQSPHSQRGQCRVYIPDDIVILDRDPSPCFRCGEREGCKHRTAFGW